MSLAGTVIYCNNIKSRHYPNIQCKSKAVVGKYCKKHSKQKNQILYVENKASILQETSASIIQKRWKKYCLKQNYCRQGPARNNYSLANNTTELYSLDDLTKIPSIFFFSFADTNKHIWGFDIRTLTYICSKSKQVKNPYTQELLSKEILKKIDIRVSYLKQKKYPIIYENSSFTSEQLWNQKVLDIFNKIEELGYIVNSDWFHELDKEDQINFYKKIYDIWSYRLELTHKQKSSIVPAYNSMKTKLFKYMPNEVAEKDERLLKKCNIQIIEQLVTSSSDKTQRSLGAMYVLMGLCSVHNDVAEAYPWIYQSII